MFPEAERKETKNLGVHVCHGDSPIEEKCSEEGKSVGYKPERLLKFKSSGELERILAEVKSLVLRSGMHHFLCDPG